MASSKRAKANRPIAIDLFTGVGGMSLGFCQAGFHVAVAADIGSINAESHDRNFPDGHFVEADLSITSGAVLLDEAKLKPGSVDVVFGGPPCQGFSLMGRRDLEDERNSMIFHFARLVEEIQPQYFVMENVPGILLGRSIDLVEKFKRRVRKAGYDLVEPVRLLNALDFGVPQDRLRAFFLGFKQGMTPPLYPESKMTVASQQTQSVWDAIGDLAHLDKFPELYKSDRFQGELGEPSEYVKSCSMPRTSDGDSNRGPAHDLGLGGCLRTKHAKEIVDRFSATIPGHTEKISRYFRLDSKGVAPTLRAGTGPDHGSHTAARPIHPSAARCITTREGARLHSYPDWFEFHPTKWHGFRQVGNSVPPVMARAVARSIVKVLI